MRRAGTPVPAGDERDGANLEQPGTGVKPVDAQTVHAGAFLTRLLELDRHFSSPRNPRVCKSLQCRSRVSEVPELGSFPDRPQPWGLPRTDATSVISRGIAKTAHRPVASVRFRPGWLPLGPRDVDFFSVSDHFGVDVD